MPQIDKERVEIYENKFQSLDYGRVQFREPTSKRINYASNPEINPKTLMENSDIPDLQIKNFSMMGQYFHFKPILFVPKFPTIMVMKFSLRHPNLTIVPFLLTDIFTNISVNKLDPCTWNGSTNVFFIFILRATCAIHIKFTFNL